jgi:uncharacterized protein (DUF1501 family)
MSHFQSAGPVGLSRRDFLRVASAGVVSLTLAELERLPAVERSAGRSCILLLLVGGPSHIDTWDPKPDAPDEVRGPFRPIQTCLAGLYLSECFPLMAQRAKHFAIIRSLHHEEAPIHETGQQLLQTGRLCRPGQEQPHYGAVLSRLLGRRPEGLPPFVIVPGPIGNTGVPVSHGQTAGGLGRHYGPTFVRLDGPPVGRAGDLDAESDAVRQRYGPSDFGRACLLARRLIERGVRLVTVNMFDTVFGRVTWDCHADGGLLHSTLYDYREMLCPMFDQAYSTLLDDLQQRGLLDSTLVVATGEFGRTPRLNGRGGRDHWPSAWSALLAGGGVQGGRVIGATDRFGSEPRDRPVSPAELAASIYYALGLDPRMPMPGDQSLPLADAAPVGELFSG